MSRSAPSPFGWLDPWAELVRRPLPSAGGGPVELCLFDAGNTIAHIDYDALARVAADDPTASALDLDAAAIREAEHRARFELARDLGPGLADGTAAADAGGAERSAGDAAKGGAGQRLEIPSVFRRYVGHVFDGLGFPDDREARLRLLLAFSEENRRRGLWRVSRPGDREALTELRDRGVRIAVVSNSDGRVADRIERVGLRDLFELIVDSAIVGVEKPDPAIFHHTLEALGGIDPARVAHVGDMAVADVLGAARSGITPILLDPLAIHADAGFEGHAIRTIDALPDLLAPR